jgi:arginyl-tRNA synthetase
MEHVDPVDVPVTVRLVDVIDEAIDRAEVVTRAFTSFYDVCPILKAEPAVRASRLALTPLTARTMACGLGLLEIAVPERM